MGRTERKRIAAQAQKRQGPSRRAPYRLAAAGLSLALAALAPVAQAQVLDPTLMPPPDLGAQGDTPPPGYMAVPVPPDTCAALAQMVRTNGYVIRPRADGSARRYVRDQSFCAEGQDTNPAWVRTQDNNRCYVGYTCGDPDMNE